MKKLLQKKLGKYPFGIWLALGAVLLTFLAWLMQAYSLLDWETAVSLGLQNSSFNGDESDIAWATKERGEAIADLIWPLPLSILAFVGLLKERFFGLVSSLMLFGICVYFPLFYLFQLWDTHPETVLGAIFLWALPSLLGILGIWVNRKKFTT